MVEEIFTGYKNPDDLTKSGRPKTVDFRIVFQNIDVNLVSCTRRVSSEHGS